MRLSTSSGTGVGYQTVQDEGSDLTQRSKMNFTGAGVTASDSGSVTSVDIPGVSGAETVQSKSTTYTATTSDGFIICSGASWTLSLYAASGNAGKRLRVKHNGTSLTQVYTIDGNASETINGSTTIALYTAGEVVEIECDGSNWHVTAHYCDTTWVSAGTFSLTLSSGGGPPTFGTTTTNRLLWCRVGSNALLRYELRQTSAGNNNGGAGTYLLPLPSGMTIDNSLVTVNTNITTTAADLALSTASFFSGQISNATASGQVNLKYYDTTHLAAVSLDYFSTVVMWGTTSYSITATNIGFSATTLQPISGWLP